MLKKIFVNQHKELLHRIYSILKNQLSGTKQLNFLTLLQARLRQTDNIRESLSVAHSLNIHRIQGLGRSRMYV